MHFAQHTKQIGIVGFKCVKCRKLITIHYHTEDEDAFDDALKQVRIDYARHLACCGEAWRDHK